MTKYFLRINLLVLVTLIICFNPGVTRASSWIEQQVENGKGTVLRFYPQDIKANTTQSTLPQEEKHYFSQTFQDGPRDNEMGIKDNGVAISRIDSLSLWTQEFDTVNTFAIVRLTTNMWRSTLESLLNTFNDDESLHKVARYWDSRPHGILQISPYGLYKTKNAFYARTPIGCELKFGYFSFQNSSIYTCRTPDVVAHETGHYVLDRLRPSFYGTNNLQTGGLHEAFGDISALSFVFENDTMVDALINSTKSNLHASNNFAALLAEEFGISLGMHGYLRNADNDYKLSDVDEEVHAISEVFTGAYYDALVEAFNDAVNIYRGRYDEASILQDIAEYGRHLFLHSIITTPNDKPNFIDIAKQIDNLADTYSKNAPVNLTYLKDLNWKKYFSNEFQRREVSSDPTTLKYTSKITNTIPIHTITLESLLGCCAGIKM